MVYLFMLNGKAAVCEDILEAEENLKEHPQGEIREFQNQNQLNAYLMSIKVNLPENHDYSTSDKGIDDNFTLNNDTVIFYVGGDYKKINNEEYISWAYTIMKDGKFIGKDSGIVPKDNEDYSLKSYLGHIVATEKSLDYCVLNNIFENIVIAHQAELIGALANRIHVPRKERTIKYVEIIENYRGSMEIHFLQVEDNKEDKMIKETNYLAARELKKLK